MFPIDKLRHKQEQRLQPPLHAWNEAKKNLEAAIALAETREKEYRKVAEDVQLKLDALQLVISMTTELANEDPPQIEEPQVSNLSLPAPEEKSLATAPKSLSQVVRVSSRRLFAANWRSPQTRSPILRLE